MLAALVRDTLVFPNLAKALEYKKKNRTGTIYTHDFILVDSIGIISEQDRLQGVSQCVGFH